MTADLAETAPFSVFDLTKVWRQADYPLKRFGKIVLDRNPENYFAEVEQDGFSPANTVPGIEPSADPVSQARLFSFGGTQRYRLGGNFNQLPINCPLQAYNPFQRDGPATINGNYGSVPNYQVLLNIVLMLVFIGMLLVRIITRLMRFGKFLKGLVNKKPLSITFLKI